MNPHFTYLLIDIGTIFFPFIFSFDKKVAFYRKWRALWPGMLLTAFVFLGWDIFFTAKGVWWFSEAYTMPYRILGLPFEEWLFFLVVPYACSFIAACLEVYLPAKSNTDTGWKAMLQFAALLIVFAFLNYRRAYTLSACGSCGTAMVAVFLLRTKNPAFRADRFLFAYALCLIPFLIVNGLLTAIPVVLYNDAENIGVRIYTIPVEDIFYGMLLVLGNVWGMKLFERHDHSDK